MNKTTSTIFESFEDICKKNPTASFLISPSRGANDLKEISYKDTLEKANGIANIFLDKQYGSNIRVATLLGSTPEHYIIKLALNKIGISVVPINPDYAPDETSYLLEDSGATMAICSEVFLSQLETAIELKSLPVPIVTYEEIDSLPRSQCVPRQVRIEGSTEASLLYTSGTTGRPKGCMLSHEYELMCGDVYANIGAPIGLSFGPVSYTHLTLPTKRIV